MGVEIERKFLVVSDSWRGQAVEETHIVQGYLASTDTLTLRVRIRGERAYFTLKGASTNISRSEFEYEIPLADARAMLEELGQGPVIDKVRHLVPFEDHTWEVDVFAGDNAGLVMAEVELSSEGEAFVKPTWAGSEVSDDARYYNVNLAREPFGEWGASD